MPYFNIVAETSENTVVTEYEPVKKRSDSYQSEAELEQEFIRMLCEQGYEYLSIHTENDLILNLRNKLEELNDYHFSDTEWQQFFKDNIANPNEHIVEKTRKIQEDNVQVLIRDNGSTKNIMLIDKTNIHNNKLQVINQYKIGMEEGAKHNNRYDVTILVNGFPLIHIELKRRGVKIREAFNQINRYQRESYTWKKGFGDVSLFAFIPKSYKEKLSCVVEFRKYNIEGAIISIDQEKLLKDYFVTKEVFQNKHIIGRETLDDDSWIEIENIRMKINAYSAYHLYCLFNDLHNVYKEAQIEINKIMGTEGLAEKNGKYLIANVSKEQWFRIIEFAQKHDCYSYNENGDEEWNIFDNKSVIDFFYLSPYFYGNKDKGIIHAEIRVEFLYNDTVNVFWIPGYKDTSYNCMEYFDNVVKWKADYTKEWFWNALIPKIREDEKEVKNKAYENSFFKKVVGIKNKIKKFLA